MKINTTKSTNFEYKGIWFQIVDGKINRVNYHVGGEHRGDTYIDEDKAEILIFSDELRKLLQEAKEATQ